MRQNRASVSLLITISEVFEFQDGTLHFAPAVPFAVVEGAGLKQGDQLELRRPDGTTLITTLHSFDFLVPSHGKVGLCLNKPLTKDEIPVGTEIWKVGGRET
jgi:hypothetical protein